MPFLRSICYCRCFSLVLQCINHCFRTVTAISFSETYDIGLSHTYYFRQLMYFSCVRVPAAHFRFCRELWDCKVGNQLIGRHPKKDKNVHDFQLFSEMRVSLNSLCSLRGLTEVASTDILSWMTLELVCWGSGCIDSFFWFSVFVKSQIFFILTISEKEPRKIHSRKCSCSKHVNQITI